MVIEKFLHSCLRITHDGHRLLTDPGAFCFADGRVKPEDLGPVDVILLTHEHPDHFEPEALRTIVQHQVLNTVILAHPPLAEKVRAAGLPCEDIAPGTARTIGAFTIEAMDTPHGPLPLPLPPHCGYLMTGAGSVKHLVSDTWSLYHPGDSLVFPAGRTVETLALPVAGPWCTIVAAVEAAKALRPKLAFPIHDAIIQPFFIDRLHWMVGEGLKGSGIRFIPAQLGEVATS